MRYIDKKLLMEFLQNKFESYKSKMVDPSKYPINHIDFMAFLAREYQALILQIEERLPEAQPEVFDTVAFQKGVQEGRRLERDEPVTDCHDLEKHTKEWVELMVGASFPEQDGDFISEEDYRNVIKKTALHFAEWMKAKMLRWLEGKVNLSYGVATDAFVEIIDKLKSL